MKPIELVRQGANLSLIHVDFMIGSNKLEIDAKTSTGISEPLFRNRDWV